MFWNKKGIKNVDCVKVGMSGCDLKYPYKGSHASDLNKMDDLQC